MSPAEALPCHHVIDEKCFEAYPEQARRLFAIKLLFTLLPGEITRRLMKLLGIDLVELLAQLGIETEDLQAAQDAADQAQALADLAQAALEQAQADWEQALREWRLAQEAANQAQEAADQAAPQDQAAAQDAADQAQAAADQAKAVADAAHDEATAAILTDTEAASAATAAAAAAAAAEAAATATSSPPADTQVTGVSPPLYIDPGGSIPRPPGENQPPLGGTLICLPKYADGYIQNGHSTWQLAHDAPEGDSGSMMKKMYSSAIISNNQPGTYGLIRRALLYFDLTPIPAGRFVELATLKVHGYYDTSSMVAVQAAEPSEPWVLADYTSFTGVFLLLQAWGTGWNNMTLGDAGKSHVTDHLGGVVAFMLRDFEYDYLNVVPPPYTYTSAGMYFSEDDTGLWPRLEVTYA